MTVLRESREQSQGPGERGDLTLLLPERVAEAYERRRAAWTSVDSAAVWLVGAHLLLLLVIVGRGALYMDDLRAQGYALNQPFLDFVIGSNGTHLAPVPRTLDWLQSRLAPLEHGPAVAVTLLIRLLLAIGFWRVLRRLFGARPATLVPFAMLLLTPALIPATTYYRQAITIVACTTAIVWALDSYLRWVLYRRPGDLVALAIITALGLGCYEKAAMIPVILLAMTVAVFGVRPGRGTPPAPGSGNPAGRFRAGLVAVGLTGVVVVIFLLIYRSGPYDQGSGGPPSVPDVLRLTWDVVTRSMIPLLLGGPFQWGYPQPYVGVPLLTGTARVFCLVLVLVGVAVALWRGPSRTVRALLLLVAWTLPSVLMVAVGRLEALGFSLGTAVRLWADLVPGFLLAGALAALPWQVGARREPGTARQAPRAQAAPGAPQAATAGGRTAPVELTVPTLAGALVVLLVLGGSVFSSLTYAAKWWDNPTGLWIANARNSLENAEPYPRMLATPLPVGVVPSFVSLVFPSDAPLLLLLRPDLRFHDGDGLTRVMNASGVRSAYIPKDLAERTAAPNQLCAANLPPGVPVPVRFPKPAPYVMGAQIQVGLLLNEPSRVAVTMTTPDGKTFTPQRFSDDELTKGAHTLLVPVPYLKSVSSVSVRVGGTATSCVVYTKVWAPLT